MTPPRKINRKPLWSLIRVQRQRLMMISWELGQVQGQQRRGLASSMKHFVPDGLSVVGSCVGQSLGSLFGTNIANASCTCSSVGGHSSMLWSFESPAKTQSLATWCYYDVLMPRLRCCYSRCVQIRIRWTVANKTVNIVKMWIWMGMEGRGRSHLESIVHSSV